MKKFAVIAKEKEYTLYLKQHFDMYFSKYATIKNYSVDEVKKLEKVEEKFIVVSSYGVLQQVKEYISDSIDFLIPGISLNREKFDEIKKIEPESKVLVVNISYRYCSQLIAMLYSAGFKKINFIPYYPGIESYDSSVEIAITPNYGDLVPEGIKKTIDIGNNYIDINDIYTVAEKLGVEKVFNDIVTEEIKKKIFMTEYNLEKLMGSKNSFLRNIGYITNEIEHGIIITDITGKIYLYNEKCIRMLRNYIKLNIGFNILEIFPMLDLLKPILKGEIERKTVQMLGGFNFELKLNPLVNDGEITGNIITIKSIGVESGNINLTKSRYLANGHVSKYSFSDIIGDSNELNETVSMAKRYAHSNSSVLITGESGTGKELFAQSMHGLSPRRNNNFVAINCSAIPDNLLESELFGYDEGAFSGAHKGGKVGIFEIANKGTVFLDEIGDMPLILQTKLLRVLEEGTLMRVGGKEVIKVDIRVISATNRNLIEMIKKGEFRQDLFYRLNVLKLIIPPLRERKKDILILHNYFMRQLECDYILDDGAKEAFLGYRWPGNIRELRNITEQLSTTNKLKITVQDIPFETKIPLYYNEIIESNSLYLKKLCIRFLLNEGKRIELFKFILEELSKIENYIGRNKLVEKAEEADFTTSEEEIKNAMRKLASVGFIISYSGRRGSKITQQGKILLNIINKITI